MSIEESLNVADEEEQRSTSASAPYMSYKGFQNYLAKFAEQGPPARFDSSYFGNASGSLVAQIRGTLRYFDLIDDERRPTQLLKTIVAADEAERKQQLKVLFEEKYADALSLDKNATSGQLAEVFRARGLAGATIQRAASFFLSMAEYVGVEVSSHFKIGRTVSANGGSRKRRPPKTPPPAPDSSSALPPKETTVTDQKAAYVNMLMDLARDNSDGDIQQALLDRIERALGIGGAGSSSTNSQQDPP
jgi:hypothetical protein